mgnify:CR=1 FL=1
MKSLQSKDNLIWIDLEMTGLDPEKEKIIEIATLITDSQLNILAEGPNLIISQPKSLLDEMDEWNQNQHGSSGLIDAVKKSAVTQQMAEIETLEFISKYIELISSIVFAPTITPFPDANNNITVFGSTILWITPGNCSGSYILLGNVLAACSKLTLPPRLIEDTIF